MTTRSDLQFLIAAEFDRFFEFDDPERRDVVTSTSCRLFVEHMLERVNKEAAHWKANHDAQVERARVLLDRPDMPLERVQAYHAYSEHQRGHARYEALRRMNPRQFMELWHRNMNGENFDAMIDVLVSNP